MVGLECAASNVMSRRRGLHNTFEAPRPKQAPKPRRLHNKFEAPRPKQAPKQCGLHNMFERPLPKQATALQAWWEIFRPTPRAATKSLRKRYEGPLRGLGYGLHIERSVRVTSFRLT